MKKPKKTTSSEQSNVKTLYDLKKILKRQSDPGVVDILQMPGEWAYLQLLFQAIGWGEDSCLLRPCHHFVIGIFAYPAYIII